MAQSYEEVRRQAAEYRKQLDRIKAQEELQDRAEAYKKTNEYKILDKFSEPYDPESYRVATSEFLDLVFFELNNYSYQKERNEKATDMLNAYEKSMSPYLSGKFSPEDLIVKKEEEIVEVVQSFPKEDIKDSKRDTKETNEERPLKTNRNKVTKRKPRQRKASKPFPRVVAVNPKRKTKRRKVKPRRKQIANNKVNTASKNNINNDVPVEYKNPMVPINEAIGYNGHPLERKYYGINSNREYLELKKEIDEFNYEDRYVPTSLLYLKSADRKLKHPEDADQYYLETVNDNLDKYMFDNQIFKDELKEKKQKDQTYLMNYINTENYTKVNQLISALSNEELQLRNNIKRLDSLIQDTVTTNSGDLSFDEREDDLKDYVTLKKDHENDLKITKRQINQLLKIRQTMKDHKSDDVKYKRTPSSKKIITDEGFVDLAQAKEALGRTEENNIIYLSYEDFITQKEIKAIIDYNNRKRKK